MNRSTPNDVNNIKIYIYIYILVALKQIMNVL